MTIGYGNKTPKMAHGWCIDRVDFEFVAGSPPDQPPSAYGTVTALVDGHKVASFTCSYNTPCPGANPVDVSPPQLADQGVALDYRTKCQVVAGNDCTAPDAVKATVTFYYELATPAAP